MACTASGQQRQTNPAPSVAQVSLFDSARAWQHLVDQCNLGPRTPGTDAHKTCRDLILGQTKKYCDDARLQELTHKWSRNGKTLTMWNVIGEQNWKDAKVRVLLIAHWDTRPTADWDPDESLRGKPILGANDGASGVAVLMELMRVMKERKQSDIGIMYLFTDGEDVGPDLDEMFLGARKFAKDLPSPKPDYGILLDMIGDRDLAVPMEPNSGKFAPSLVKAFYDNCSVVGLGRYFPKRWGPVIEDDHICINEAGIPTMDLIDFDYQPWHTTRDTVDKCSAESLGVIGKALETWLVRKPTFVIPKGG